MQATNELYHQYKNMIHYFVKRIKENYPSMDTQDLYSEANWCFLYAIRSYKEGRSPLHKWISSILAIHLIQYCKKEAKKYKSRRTTRLGDNQEHSLKSTPQFDLDRFLFELSPDAQQLTKLLVDTNAPAQSRKRLIRMGWSRWRVAKAFKEVNSALID
jgi:DNA-directed RNA polymerase specialized sigma24 family protein